jgi:hypothetical protein
MKYQTGFLGSTRTGHLYRLLLALAPLVLTPALSHAACTDNMSRVSAPQESGAPLPPMRAAMLRMSAAPEDAPKAATKPRANMLRAGPKPVRKASATKPGPTTKAVASSTRVKHKPVKMAAKRSPSKPKHAVAARPKGSAPKLAAANGPKAPKPRVPAIAAVDAAPPRGPQPTPVSMAEREMAAPAIYALITTTICESGPVAAPAELPEEGVTFLAEEQPPEGFPGVPSFFTGGGGPPPFTEPPGGGPPPTTPPPVEEEPPTVVPPIVPPTEEPTPPVKPPFEKPQPPEPPIPPVNPPTEPPTGPVPEPSTWAMMILGFGSIGYVIRRRRLQGRLLA